MCVTEKYIVLEVGKKKSINLISQYNFTMVISLVEMFDPVALFGSSKDFSHCYCVSFHFKVSTRL